MTPVLGKLSISPESSNGFASVGTILPKEEATLLPGGLFVLIADFKVQVLRRDRFGTGGFLCFAALKEQEGAPIGEV